MVLLHDTDLVVFLYLLQREHGYTESHLEWFIDQVQLTQGQHVMFSDPKLEASARRLAAQLTLRNG